IAGRNPSPNAGKNSASRQGNAACLALTGRGPAPRAVSRDLLFVGRIGNPSGPTRTDYQSVLQKNNTSLATARVPALETRALGSTIAPAPDSAVFPARRPAHGPRRVGFPLAEPSPERRRSGRRPAALGALLLPPGRPGSGQA